MVGLMVPSKRVYAKGDLPRLLLPVPRPCGEPLPTHASTADPPALAGSFGSVSCGVALPFLWVLVCERFCLCPPSKNEICFPSSCGSSIIRLAGLQGQIPGDTQSLCWIPKLGSLAWGSEPSQQWENFFGIVVVLQFVGHSPGGYGI